MGKNEELHHLDFYKDYYEVNPALVLGLIIISAGLYIINWIFVKNKDFEKADKFAPDSKRGAFILMILPFSWFFFYIILKKLFLISSDNLFFGILQIVGWGLILFLILKYLFDFCQSFGRITKTSGFNWFILLFIGIIGLVLTGMTYYYFSVLIFFLIITIPSMQSELNSHINRHFMKKKSNIFYS